MPLGRPSSSLLQRRCLVWSTVVSQCRVRNRRVSLFSSESSTAITIRAADETANTSEVGSEEFQTGRVMLYDTSKFFGFIIPDDAILPWGPSNIYFHRRGIKSNLEKKKEFLWYPKLKQDERVRFQTGVDQRGSKIALNITWEDGTPIPPLRSAFLSETIHDAKKRFCRQMEVIFGKKTLKGGGGDEGETQSKQWNEIHNAYTSYQKKIENAKDLIQKVGMNIDDFSVSHDNEPEEQDDDDNNNNNQEGLSSTGPLDVVRDSSTRRIQMGEKILGILETHSSDTDKKRLLEQVKLAFANYKEVQKKSSQFQTMDQIYR